MPNTVTECDEHLLRMLEGSGAVYWDWELATGKIEYSTAALTRLLGYRPEDLEPNIRVWDELLHPEDKPGTWAAIKAHVEGHAPDFQADYRLRSKSGDWPWFHAHARIVLRDPQGRPLHMAGILADINERKRVEEKLRESELWFRLLIENVSDVIGLIGLDGAIRYVSPAVKAIGGYDPEELLGKKFLDLIHPDDKPAILEKVDQLIRNPEMPHKAECRYRHKDGSWHSVETSATNLSSRPEVGGIVVAMRDVTDRKLAESAQTQLAAIVESSRDGIIGVDSNGKIINWNTGAQTIYGYHADEVIGRHVGMLAPPERSQEGADIVRRVVQGEEVPCIETVRKRKDGSHFDVSMMFSPILDARANIVGVSAFVRDITERKRAERAHMESDRRFTAMLQNVELISLMLDIRADIVFCNDYFLRLTGWARDEVLGQNWFERFVPPEIMQTTRSVFDELTADNPKAWHHESEILTRSGTRRLIRWNNTVLRSVSGEVIGTASIGADITDYRAIENERRRHAEAIHRGLEQTIQAVAMALEKRDVYTAGHMRRVADLAAAIAQDLGLPEDQVRGVEMAASIHDVGKIYLPAEILSKPTRLTDIEYSLVKTHAQAGYEILKGVEFPWPIAEIVYQHHEQMDGTGYPRGLKGDQILLEARIIAVADTIEAMASHRPYRPGIGLEAALEEIAKKRGTSYDAAVVDACLRLFRDKGYRLPTQKAA